FLVRYTRRVQRSRRSFKASGRGSTSTRIRSSRVTTRSTRRLEGTRSRRADEKSTARSGAVHVGCYSTVGCISYPNGGGEGAMKYAPGAMGVHFLNLANVVPNLDPDKSQVLIDA